MIHWWTDRLARCPGRPVPWQVHTVIALWKKQERGPAVSCNGWGTGAAGIARAGLKPRNLKGLFEKATRAKSNGKILNRVKTIDEIHTNWTTLKIMCNLLLVWPVRASAAIACLEQAEVRSMLPGACRSRHDPPKHTKQ